MASCVTRSTSGYGKASVRIRCGEKPHEAKTRKRTSLDQPGQPSQSMRPRPAPIPARRTKGLAPFLSLGRPVATHNHGSGFVRNGDLAPRTDAQPEHGGPSNLLTSFRDQAALHAQLKVETLKRRQTSVDRPAASEYTQTGRSQPACAKVDGVSARHERDPENCSDPGRRCRRLQPARRGGRGGNAVAAAGAAQRSD